MRIYEINTAVWLKHLGVAGLDHVPGRAWDALAALPVDADTLLAAGKAGAFTAKRPE